MAQYERSLSLEDGMEVKKGQEDRQVGGRSLHHFSMATKETTFQFGQTLSCWQCQGLDVRS